MTSDEQKSSDPKAGILHRLKERIRQSVESQSVVEELSGKLEAAIKSGAISENEDADSALRKLFEPLELTELFMAYEESGFENTLSAHSTVRELLWLLKIIEIDEEREDRR